MVEMAKYEITYRCGQSQWPFGWGVGGSGGACGEGVPGRHVSMAFRLGSGW